jgi:O-antigen ligase
VLANHVIFQQVGSAKNDLAVAALFIAALYYGFRHAATAGTGHAALAGIAVGLLAGTKYYAAGYAAVAGLAIVVAAGRARGPRFAGTTALTVLALALLFGGYWYGRNFWLTGTPIYPKGFTGQTDVLSQRRDDIWTTTLFGNGRPEVFPLLVHAVGQEAGPCAVTALLGLPLVGALLLVPPLWPVAAERGRWMRLPLVLALAGAGLIWGVTPFGVERH